MTTISTGNTIAYFVICNNLAKMTMKRLKALDEELTLQSEGNLDEKKTEEFARMMQILLFVGKLITNEPIQELETIITTTTTTATVPSSPPDIKEEEEETLAISLLDVTSQLTGILTLTKNQGYTYYGPLGIMRKLMLYGGFMTENIPKDAFINLLFVYFAFLLEYYNQKRTYFLLSNTIFG